MIGAVRQVHFQYVQGFLACEDVPPGWRLDPLRFGGSMILIDIGIYAHHWAITSPGLVFKVCLRMLVMWFLHCRKTLGTLIFTATARS